MDETNDREVPPVCRFLRTKAAFGRFSGPLAPWRAGRSSTAVYWCLKTMESFGEDQGIAHPDACRAGRRCCELRAREASM